MIASILCIYTSCVVLVQSEREKEREREREREIGGEREGEREIEREREREREREKRERERDRKTEMHVHVHVALFPHIRISSLFRAIFFVHMYYVMNRYCFTFLYDVYKSSVSHKQQHITHYY